MIRRGVVGKEEGVYLRSRNSGKRSLIVKCDVLKRMWSCEHTLSEGRTMVSQSIGAGETSGTEGRRESPPKVGKTTNFRKTPSTRDFTLKPEFPDNNTLLKR
jgi:hypothetical protein